MARTKIMYVIGLTILLVILAEGCQQNSRGAVLFAANRCNECHEINGKGGAVGPNLTRVGTRRSRQYIIDQIRNPSSHNPNTAMPSFSSLPEQDINDLANYLSGLK